MAVQVDFITLGDASEKLNVPSPTLRHWTQQLEDYNVHFVKRNNRNERIYYDTDLEIFKYLRDLKAEHGRRTTTKDLAFMIKDRAEKGELKIRSKEDAPSPSQPSNKTAELLNQEDIKRLMDSDRVKQFMEVTSKQLKVELVEEMREVVREEVSHEVAEAQEKTIEEIRALKDALEEREAQATKILMELLDEKQKRREEKQQLEEELKQEKAKKGFFSKLFGG